MGKVIVMGMLVVLLCTAAGLVAGFNIGYYQSREEIGFLEAGSVSQQPGGDLISQPLPYLASAGCIAEVIDG